eukprot:TRINITY_DN3943_c0_g1_i2.p1 TRINITY_DN3943_c0_g1~~TRINITY_DN3943_c0_g1_i2.p1  ORF type:complete len:1168 (+),score=123.76 TRINITY_DN3943_c0_g1_i2:29-3505(+)
MPSLFSAATLVALRTVIFATILHWVLIAPPLTWISWCISTARNANDEWGRNALPQSSVWPLLLIVVCHPVAFNTILQPIHRATKFAIFLLSLISIVALVVTPSITGSLKASSADLPVDRRGCTLFPSEESTFCKNLTGYRFTDSATVAQVDATIGNYMTLVRSLLAAVSSIQVSPACLESGLASMICPAMLPACDGTCAAVPPPRSLCDTGMEICAFSTWGMYDGGAGSGLVSGVIQMLAGAPLSSRIVPYVKSVLDLNCTAFAFASNFTGNLSNTHGPCVTWESATVHEDLDISSQRQREYAYGVLLVATVALLAAPYIGAAISHVTGVLPFRWERACTATELLPIFEPLNAALLTWTGVVTTVAAIAGLRNSATFDLFGVTCRAVTAACYLFFLSAFRSIVWPKPTVTARPKTTPTGIALQRLQAQVRKIGIYGEYYGQRLIVSGAVQLAVQFVVFLRAAPNSDSFLLLFSVVVMSLQLIGLSIILHDFHRTNWRFRYLFLHEVLLQGGYLVFNIFLAPQRTFVGTVGVAMPALSTAFTTRSFLTHRARRLAAGLPLFVAPTAPLRQKQAATQQQPVPVQPAPGLLETPVQIVPEHTPAQPVPVRPLDPYAAELQWAEGTLRASQNVQIATTVDDTHVLLRRLRRVALTATYILAFLLGCAFFSIAVARTVIQNSRCRSELGPYWRRVHPKIFYSNGFVEESSCPWDQITSLNASGVGSPIPTNIDILTKLRVLDASNNNLVGLPSSVGQLSQLEKLYLRNNHITHLPYSVSNHSKVTILAEGTPIWTKLDLSNNAFGINCSITSDGEADFLPVAVRRSLHAVRVLILSSNSFQTWPAGLNTAFPVLEELDLSLNNLSAIPSNLMIRHGNLRRLNVSRNSRLQTADLTFTTPLTPLATEDGELDVSFTALTSVPALPRTTLYVQGNPQMQALIWHGVNATYLPDSLLLQLPQLVFVRVTWAPLFSRLPATLWELPNVEELNFGQSLLSEIPRDIAKLTKLRTLSLSDTAIVDLPQELADSNLEFLDISGWNITKLPAIIWRLPNLYKLVANGLTNLVAVPLELPSQLTALQVQYCGITELPAAFFENNPQLVDFEAFHNPFAAGPLPMQICSWKNFHYITFNPPALWPCGETASCRTFDYCNGYPNTICNKTECRR